MKKLFVCLLSIVLLLSGCHGSSNMSTITIPETFETSEQYEITFWAKNDTNKTQVQIYRDTIAAFEQLYPNITVNLKLYTDYGKIYNDVITNISTNTTPDICITYPDHIATYLTGTNVVVPLDDLMDDTKYGFGGTELMFDGVTKDEVSQTYLNEGILNDAYYALPFMRSSEAIYINKTYVEALGYTVPETLTWDFIWEVSEAATAQDENGNYIVNGQKVMIPFIYKSTDNMMIQYLSQNDAGYSNENGDIEIFNDTTKEFLQTISNHVSTGAFSTFKQSGYPANFLNAGQCLFAIDSTAGSTWMGSDAPLSDIAEENKVQFETVVRTVPQIDIDNPKMISQGPSICLFNHQDDQRTLAAWLFAQYLLTNDVQIAYASTEGYVPVTTKAQNSDAYQQYLSASGSDNNDHYSIKIEATKLVLNHIDDTFTTDVFNGSASLRTASGQLIEETLKSTKRGQTIDDTYIESLYDKVTSLYHLDQLDSSISGSKQDLGPLPTGSKLLLGILVIAWIGIAFVYFKQKKNI